MKNRTIVFHNKLGARNYMQRITNLNLFLNLFTLYYHDMKGGGG